MPTTQAQPRRTTAKTREIIEAKDVIKLYGCSLTTAYRTIQRAKTKAGRMNAPLTVDQFSNFSGISRSRIKEVM